MSAPSTSTPLPSRPDLQQLKKQAKELRASGAHPTLADAQRAVARQHGFASWTKLKIAVEQVTLRRLIEEADVSGTRALLASSPSLAKLPFDDGATPLHVAAGENRPEIIAVLVQAGALVRARYGKWAHSPLSWAVTCWAFDAARKLVDLGETPDLFGAAGLGLLDRVKAFWRDGRLARRPSRTGSSRYTEDGALLQSPPDADRDQVSDALYIACRCDRLEVARWLLDHGADPNWRGYAGATCLAWAEFSGNAELCALLRERGGNDTIRDVQYRATPAVFPLMVFAGWGFPKELIARLSAAPSLVSVRAGCGTPLHAAAKGGQTATAKILLHFGADRSAQDDDGRVPADLAESAGHASLALLLKPPAP